MVAVAKVIDGVGVECGRQRRGGRGELGDPLPTDGLRDGRVHVRADCLCLNHRVAEHGDGAQDAGDRALTLLDQRRAGPLGLTEEPSGNPFVCLDDRVGQCRSPLDRAHGKDREPPSVGQFTQAVRVVALALTAKLGDPMGRHAVDHVRRDRERAQPLEAVEQAVGISRVAARLMPAQPYEARQGAGRTVLDLFGQHAGKLRPNVRGQLVGNAVSDQTFGGNQRVGARPLHGRRPGHDDPPAAHLVEGGCRQRLARASADRSVDKPTREPLAHDAFEGSVAVEPLQSGRVLVVRLGSGGVVGDRLATQTKLRGDEGEHGLGDRLALRDQTSGVAQGAELEREPKPVAVSAPAPDVREVRIAQDAVPDEVRLLARKGEQESPLAGGQNGASGHGRILAWSPSKRRVRASLNAVSVDARLASFQRIGPFRSLNRTFATRGGPEVADTTDRWNGADGASQRRGRTTMLVGYARVSKTDGSQSLDLQRDALLKEGVISDAIYDDHASGKLAERPGLTACMKALRKDDVLVVWKLDRLGRSLAHLVDTVTTLNDRTIAVSA